MLDLPTLHLDIDRDRMTQVGMSARDVAQSVLVSLSGSFQTAPNFWLNPANGVTYQMAVQSPQYRITSLQDLMNTPVNDPSAPRLSRCWATWCSCQPTSRAAVVNPLQRAAGDRRLCQYAGPRSWRQLRRDVKKVLEPFQQHLPRGTRLVVRGQVETMRPRSRPWRRTGDGDRAGLLPDRGELPVVARSVHHHHGAAGGAGGNLLDAAADAHHHECAGADWRGDVHGSGNGQLDSDGVVRARPT